MKKNRLYSIIGGVLLGTLPIYAAFDSISISSSHDSNFNNDDTVQFTWQAPDTNNSWVVDEYRYLVDTNSSTSVTVNDGSTQTTSHTTNSLSDGTYYFHVAPYGRTDTNATVLGATDTFGPIKIDTTAPTSLTINPVAGSYGEQIVTLGATDASDNAGVKIYYTTDGSDVNESNVSSANLYNDTNKFTLYSQKTVNFKATDTAGNWSSQTSQVVTPTYTGNIPTISGVTDGSTIATQSIGGNTNFTENITVSAGDKNVTNYEYKIDNGAWSTSNYTTAQAIDISGLNDGNYTLSVIGIDSFGNKQTTDDAETLSFNVDNSAPTGLVISYDGNTSVTVVNPDNDTNANTIVTLNASDANETKYDVIAGSANCPTSYTDVNYNLYSTAFSLGDTFSDGQEVKVCMVAKDVIGNVAKTSKTFIIDQSAPIIVITPDSEKVFAQQQEVTFSSETNASLYFRTADNNTSVTQPTTLPLNGWTEGNNTTVSSTKFVYALAVDSVNNIGTMQYVKFTKQSAGVTELSLDVNGIDFGDVESNQTGSSTFTISNTGSESYDLNSSSVNLVGGNVSDVNITTTNCITTLDSTDTCTETITFTPMSKGDINGTLVISYEGTNASELNITLSGTGIGYVPVFTSDANFTTNEDTNYSGNIGVYDGDMDDINYSVTSNVSNGTLELNATSGAFTYSPALNFNGTDMFSVSATDGANPITQEINITVTADNDAPLFMTNLMDMMVNEDNGTLSYELNVTDPDSDLNITVMSSNTSIVTVMENWTGLQNQGQNPGLALEFNLSTVQDAYGDVVITIMAHDGESNMTMMYDYNVSSVNDAPVFGTNVFDNNISMDEDNVTVIEVNASDVDMDSLSVQAMSSDGNVSVSFTDMNITLTPAPDWYGQATIYLVVDDGNTTDNNVTTMFTLTVDSINDAPTATSIPDQLAITNQSFEANISSYFNDVDMGDVLTYTSNEDLDWLELNSSTGVFTSISQPTSTMDRTEYNVTATDTNGSSVTTTVALTVVAGPTISSVEVEQLTRAKETDEVNVSINFSEDVNVTGTGTITITLNTGESIVFDVNDGETISEVNGTLTVGNDSNESIFVTDINVSGTVLTGQVSGVEYAQSTQTTLDEITNLKIDNDKPVFNSNTTVIAYENNISIGYVLSAVDADNNLSYMLFDQNDSEHFDFNTTTLVLDFNATKDYETMNDENMDNNYTLRFGVQDSIGNQQDFNLTVVLMNVNEAPVFGANIFDNNYTMNEDNVTVIEVLASDEDAGTTLTYNATSSVSDVVVGFVENNLTITPAMNWYGEANISIMVHDGNTSDNNATTMFTLTVDAVNDMPSGFALESNTTGTTDYNTTFVATFVDDSNDSSIGVTIPVIDGYGSVNIDSLTFGTANVGTGMRTGMATFTYTPDVNFTDNGSFTVMVDDSEYNQSIDVSFSVTLLDTIDSDNNGIGDATEGIDDNDSDGEPNYRDANDDDDTLSDSEEITLGSNRLVDDIDTLSLANSQVSLLSINAVAGNFAEANNINVMWSGTNAYALEDTDMITLENNGYVEYGDTVMDASKGLFVVPNDGGDIYTITNDTNVSGSKTYVDGWSVHGNDTGETLDFTSFTCENSNSRIGAVLTLKDGDWGIYIQNGTDIENGRTGPGSTDSVEPNFGYMVWCISKD